MMTVRELMRYLDDKLEYYKRIVRDEIGFGRLKRAEIEWYRGRTNGGVNLAEAVVPAPAPEDAERQFFAEAERVLGEQASAGRVEQ